MDFRKCQTSTASPAEPGELPFALGMQTRGFLVCELSRISEICLSTAESSILTACLSDCTILSIDSDRSEEIEFKAESTLV